MNASCNLTPRRWAPLPKEVQAAGRALAANRTIIIRPGTTPGKVWLESGATGEGGEFAAAIVGYVIATGGDLEECFAAGF
jgi:hypothetical protein